MCQSKEGVGKAGNYYKTMSTIPKTNFCQINFKASVTGVRFDFLGRGKCGLICNIMNGERCRFTRDDSIHMLCICTIIEESMGCKKLGSRV